MSTPLRIDIVSDVMCPWCIIGYRQLVTALEASGTEHEIHWLPFELNPDMPTGGQNLREHIIEKYGTTPEQSEESRKKMTEVGTALGINFRFTEEMRMHNTFNAHQLLHWADTQECMHDLKQALFIAHFTNSRDLSDIQVLADVAAETGLDRTEALAVLEDQRFASEVRKVQSFWVQQGIRGVPAVIFNGQHLVTGAQGSENYTSILNELAKLSNSVEA